MGHRSKQSERCDRCRMHQERCFCHLIIERDLQTRLVLVMHAREVRKTTATGPLALSVLKNSELHVHGQRELPLDLSHLFEGGRRVLVLFPSEGAKSLLEVAKDRDPRPVTLVVPDGNWRQAARVPKRVAGLDRAEAVTLPSGEGTRWGLRRETKAEGLATFEAIARAFGILESKDLQIELERLFEHMVEESFAARGYDRDGSPRSAVAEFGANGEPELKVLYSDEHLLVVDKPAGLLIRRGWGSDELPAVRAVSTGPAGRLFSISPLDRATSGIQFFARTEATAEKMRLQFTTGLVELRYLVACRGLHPEIQRVTHALSVSKTEKRQLATTEFRYLGSFEDLGLYEARPSTLVQHQIRRHLKHRSLPVLGDVRYGKGEINRLCRERFSLSRLALHSHKLRFTHPTTQQIVQLEAPVPAALHELFSQFSDWPDAGSTAQTQLCLRLPAS